MHFGYNDLEEEFNLTFYARDIFYVMGKENVQELFKEAHFDDTDVLVGVIVKWMPRFALFMDNVVKKIGNDISLKKIGSEYHPSLTEKGLEVYAISEYTARELIAQENEVFPEELEDLDYLVTEKLLKTLCVNADLEECSTPRAA